ncbi:hypothetical protein LSTR_LSTR004514 [Laodelphax striatellus]|uniref:Uncharacterized protein n=1 Tax=Laodelphax striatellus TaxID=195883 RepID=A0A482XHA2_LAOST|nr:hypothetical protein LSTR_LSTR004514 [Laodelphax striatellus]
MMEKKEGMEKEEEEEENEKEEENEGEEEEEKKEGQEGEGGGGGEELREASAVGDGRACVAGVPTVCSPTIMAYKKKAGFSTRELEHCDLQLQHINNVRLKMFSSFVEQCLKIRSFYLDE